MSTWDTKPKYWGKESISFHSSHEQARTLIEASTLLSIEVAKIKKLNVLIDIPEISNW
jgi:hypothetical protein